MLFARCFYKLKCLREVKPSLKFIKISKPRDKKKINNNSGSALNRLYTSLEMDSLLHIETNKQKIHQIDEDFIQLVYSASSKIMLLSWIIKI